jgi:hypothetical protein
MSMLKRSTPLVVAAMLALAGCASGSSGGSPVASTNSSQVPASAGVAGATIPTAAVEPSSDYVGPAATNPTPVLAETVNTWTTMTSTLYDHKYYENTKTGVYRFDCVGATSYFLKAAAPRANNALNQAEHIASGYVPTPARYAEFFRSLPAAGTPEWMPLDSPASLVGGEIIIVPPPASGENASGATIPGHALVAAGPAVQLTDGGYAVLVYDSTAMPHGTADTRLTDPRNQPLPPKSPGGPPRPSGLGRGTIELRQISGQQGWFMYWSVDGTYQYGAAIALARPLS